LERDESQASFARISLPILLSRELELEYYKPLRVIVQIRVNIERLVAPCIRYEGKHLKLRRIHSETKKTDYWIFTFVGIAATLIVVVAGLFLYTEETLTEFEAAIPEEVLLHAQVMEEAVVQIADSIVDLEQSIPAERLGSFERARENLNLVHSKIYKMSLAFP